MTYNIDRLRLAVPCAPAGPQIFIYGPASASDTQTDAVATVRGSTYLVDAKAKGMRVNDVVMVIDTATPLVSWSRCSVISAAGVATLAA